MDEAAYVEELSSKPFASRLLGYMRLSGPGYMQSAMTLGGGSVASCAVLGSLLGYELLWVQPLAMLLGYFVLAAVAKQTCHTEQRPYGVFWKRLHPALAIIWAVSALLATIIWHIPQYSLTANGIVTLAEGAGANLDGTTARWIMGAIILLAAVFIVFLYNLGARGIKLYETAVKTLVWCIVIAFAIVVFYTGVDFKRLVLGLSGISFYRDLTDGNGLDPDAIAPIVAGMAATVGINMIFLYPYSLLNKKWGPKYKELAYFDLVSGMAIPFMLATGFMILAVANTIGPAEGHVGSTLGAGVKSVRDIRQIIPVLAPTFAQAFGMHGGQLAAGLLIGLGMTAIGFSTIITHMLACGFIACEMLDIEHGGKARFWFSLLPAVGVIGVGFKFPIPLAITASTLAAPLMPVAVICFLVLLNRKDYMGTARPQGTMRWVWNVMLSASIIIMSVAAWFSLQGNWDKLQHMLHGPGPAAASAGTEGAPKAPITPSPAAQPPAVTPAPVTPEATTGEASPEAGKPVMGKFTHQAMGTEWAFVLYGEGNIKSLDDLERIANEAFGAVDDIEHRISTWQPTSRTSYINKHAAQRPVTVDEDIMELLHVSKDVYKDTGGAFDITVGPLIQLWGFYRKAGHVPSKEEIDAVLQNVGLNKVRVDSKNNTVAFDHPGMRLDFGGIGKGYALDKAAEILKYYGIKRALLHGGKSTVLALGPPPDRPGWTVGILDPYNKQDRLGTLVIHDESLSTSGCYGTMLKADDETICNILNPATGQPVKGMISATAIAPTGTLTDALSTAFLVMGIDGTRHYCKMHQDIRAILAAKPKSGEPEPVYIGFPKAKG